MQSDRHILVVEDNDFIRMQIAGFLKDAGYHTLEANEGNKALDLINDKISLAIVDVRMQPMGGFDFIAVMRSRGYQTPVILVTGDNNSDLLSRATHHGVASVLLKPVQKERLLTMVAKLAVRVTEND